MTLIRILLSLWAALAATNAVAQPAAGRSAQSGIAREVLLLSTPDGVQLSALLTYPAVGFNAAAPAIIHIAAGLGTSIIAPAEPARLLAEGLAAQGYGNLTLETRLTERYAFSRFDEATTDIKAAVDALAARGVTRVVIAGGGLGATLAARYAAQSGDVRVRGVMVLSPGEDPTPALAAKVGADKLTAMIADAAKAIETGDRAFVDLGDGIIFTPATFLDWYGPDAPTALAPNLADVEAPLLISAGSERLEALRAAATASLGVTLSSNTNTSVEALTSDVAKWLAAEGLASPALVRTQILDVKSADGTMLSGVLYTPAATPAGNRPAFIIVHGWASDVMRSTAHWLGLRLAQRGYAAVAIRHRDSGFRGAVGGRLEDIPPDIAAWVDLMSARGYGKLIGVGHSAGNLWLSYYLATTQDTRLKGLVYLAPQRDLPNHARLAMGEDLYARTVLEAEEAVRDGQGATHLIDAPFPRAVYDEDERQPMYISPPASGFTYYDASAFLSYWGPQSKAVHSKLIKQIKAPLLALGGSRDPFMQGGWLIQFTEAAGPLATYKFYGGPTGAPHSFEGYQTLVTDDILAWVSKTIP